MDPQYVLVQGVSTPKNHGPPAAGELAVYPHPERERIDRQLARGGGTVVLGRRYALNKDVLRIHRERHLLYLLDPALGLGPEDLSGIVALRITSTVRKPAN